MNVGELKKRLAPLPDDMDVNELREHTITTSGDVEQVRKALDDTTREKSWEQYGAQLLSKIVVPLLLETRDTLMLPTSERGWSKPAEFAKKLDAKVAAIKQQLEVDAAQEAAAMEEGHRAAIAQTEQSCRDQIDAATEEKSRAMTAAAERCSEATEEVKAAERRNESALDSQREETQRAKGNAADTLASIPHRQAEEVAVVLDATAQELEDAVKARLGVVFAGKRKRPRILGGGNKSEEASIRAEADGLSIAAKRLRALAAYARKRGRCPLELLDCEDLSGLKLPEEAEC